MDVCKRGKLENAVYQQNILYIRIGKGYNKITD